MKSHTEDVTFNPARPSPSLLRPTWTPSSEAGLHPLRFNTKKKRELAHLTRRLEEVLARAVEEAFMLVSAMHITAGVFVNDNEPAAFDGQRSKRLIVQVLGE